MKNQVTIYFVLLGFTVIGMMLSLVVNNLFTIRLSAFCGWLTATMLVLTILTVQRN